MTHRFPLSIVSVLLLAALLTGLAQVAVQPPWEGFDETAHYSYVQQLAETGRWPRFGDRMSQDVDAYLEAIPSLGYIRWNYRALFASSKEELARALITIKHPPAEKRTWRSGKIVNWEAQHPPLYYALLAPIYRLSDTWSLAHQLLLLRTVSYLLAWLGLCVAVLSLSLEDYENSNITCLAIGLWPILFPMWFPEMGRLGNDSLLVFVTACCLPLLFRLTQRSGSSWHYAALGLLIGLGLLTKATFLPFAASVGAILLFALVAKWHASDFLLRLSRLALMVLVAGLVCGWWYFGKYLETGNWIGSSDLAYLSTGPIDNSNSHLIPKLPWLLIQTFLWYGSWSSGLPPRLLCYALMATPAVLALGTFNYLQHNSLGTMGRIALLTLGMLLAGLTYMAVVTRGGMGGGAWYLHAFAPILAVLLGFGIAGCAEMKLGRVLLACIGGFSLMFLLIATATNVLHFAGCGTSEENSSYYDLFSASHCAGDLRTILDRLEVLSFPTVFLPLLVSGWILWLSGMTIGLGKLFSAFSGAKAVMPPLR